MAAPADSPAGSRTRRLALAVAGSAIAIAVAVPAVVSSDARDRAGVVAKRVGGKADIREITRTYGATAGDINGDGHEDAVIVRHWAAFPRVYINRGNGRFVNIVPTHFPQRRVGARDRHDCPIGDVTGDGRADIYCTIGGKKGGTAATPNELWVQQEDGTFVNWRKSDFNLGAARNLYGRGRDARFLDANGDGFLDLYVLNAYPRKDGRSGKSRLFINEGGERFVSALRHGFTNANREIGANSLQATDYDGDGRTDLLVCGEKGVRLYRNFRERNFRDVTARKQIRMGCVEARLARIDRSGRPGLIRLGSQALTVHKQRPGGRFGPPVFRRRIGHAEAIAVGDSTGNRLADIYVLRRGVRNRDKPDTMLLNRRRGREFRRVPIPQLRRGRGDAVTTIDHDGNGLADFIVMNGHRKVRGPVDLIAFQRRRR